MGHERNVHRKWRLEGELKYSPTPPTKSAVSISLVLRVSSRPYKERYEGKNRKSPGVCRSHVVSMPIGGKNKDSRMI